MFWNVREEGQSFLKHSASISRFQFATQVMFGENVIGGRCVLFWFVH